tara:strand:+ start:658 stop:1122 length:465 start_codon:yes stop_codon:yes gene_type:complete
MALITLNKLALPTGNVIQVKSAFLNLTAVNTSSTSFVATGLSVSITPSSTSNKIFLSLQGGAMYNTTTASVSQKVTIYRDSTNLGDSTHGLSRFSSPGGSWTIVPHSISVLDTPSSTSSITYEVYFKNDDTSATVQFSSGDRGYPTLTAYEIVG